MTTSAAQLKSPGAPSCSRFRAYFPYDTAVQQTSPQRLLHLRKRTPTVLLRRALSKYETLDPGVLPGPACLVQKPKRFCTGGPPPAAAGHIHVPERSRTRTVSWLGVAR